MSPLAKVVVKAIAFALMATYVFVMFFGFMIV